MKALLLTTLLAMSIGINFASSGFAHIRKNGSRCDIPPNDGMVIRQLNAAWLNSYMTRDTATLSQILAPDFELTNPLGKKFHKKDTLSNLLNPDITYTSVNVDSVDVRVFGNTAVINCAATFVFKSGGKELTGHNCYMDVYVKRNGHWQAVAAHVTLLQAEK